MFHLMFYFSSTSLENAIVGFNIPPELLFASKRQMEYVAQRELKQVGIKQTFPLTLDGSKNNSRSEGRISGGNWFSFVKRTSRTDLIEGTQKQICCCIKKLTGLSPELSFFLITQETGGGGGGDGAVLYCGVREDNISLLDIYCGLQVKPWPGHSIRPIRRY